MRLVNRPEVESLLKKIQQENLAENDFKQANSLHFVVRYEGSESNRALGQGILASLERSFTELENQLDYSPRDSIAVVLYPDEVFQDVTKMPGWVGALNDGKIRFPIKGLTFVDDTVRGILKHELTHSFIRLKTVSLSWLLPGSLLQRSGLSMASVTAAVFNPWLIYADKKLNGQDPEFYNSGGVAQPIQKQFTLALKVGI